MSPPARQIASAYATSSSRNVSAELTPTYAGGGRFRSWPARAPRRAAPPRKPYAAGPARDDLGRLGAALVRPDGIIAWASGPAPDRDAFREAAALWFGAPRKAGQVGATADVSPSG